MFMCEIAYVHGMRCLMKISTCAVVALGNWICKLVGWLVGFASCAIVSKCKAPARSQTRSIFMQ